MITLYQLFTYLLLPRIFTTVLVIFLLLWIARDYPAWRESRLLSTTQDRKTHNSHDAVSSSQSDKKDINPKEPSSSHHRENLSIAHYILAAPVATFYIAGRALYDLIKFGLFRLLWLGEQLAPKLDAWLFHTVTVLLPNKVEAAESWWERRGKLIMADAQRTMQERFLPTTVRIIEHTCIALYKGYLVLEQCMVRTYRCWRQFYEKHDWRQLALDLADVWYTNFWIPVSHGLSRLYNLSRVIYRGCLDIAISLWQDIQWLFTVIVPAIELFIRSTTAWTWVTSTVQHIYTQALSAIRRLHPIYVFLHTLSLQLLDTIVKALHSHTFQRRLLSFRQFLGSHTVWLLCEALAMMGDTMHGAEWITVHFITPTVMVFMAHVLPRLSVAYKQLRDTTVALYEKYLCLAWTAVYPYLQQPWQYMIHSLYGILMPVLGFLQSLYTCSINTINRAVYSMMPLGTAVLFQVASWCQQWSDQLKQTLEKQLPVVYRGVHVSYEWVYSHDWQGLADDLIAVLMAIRSIAYEQCQLVYSSLERTVHQWAKEQASYHDKAGPSKID
ncbi:uncharacterized protein BYT42DRAFT_504479 [Radiomyces spectabilis]|uniref:uncharacterized protein n=1 Tax=Radiomyces spectabilis TaxID=64574 RepID=UPI00221FA80D|nr:uncharacterized protein BYT42DRAFT_504479 [Radiomyces spectabilis]KAI8367602.1 hypothetical protein BYT42DRAFT_504479 [Radiomyces spectabilis]